jgi:murein DD-endopeptidase MepM/ murein hydrolase activator NlpD
MVVLKHPRSGLMSVYAHLQRPLVKKGQWVSKGQKIALSGESGRASGPHLHFEIRNGVTAIDPVQMMTTQLAKQGRG